MPHRAASLSLLSMLAAAGCTKASSPTTRDGERGVTTPSPVTVALAAVTFADDCGGTPPFHAPPAAAPSPAEAMMPAAPADTDLSGATGIVAAKRRCEQTSMQLAVSSTVASTLHIKSVEVFDDAGRSLGALQATLPTRWSEANAAYEPWDEQIAAGQAAVSYVLSQPPFVDRFDSRDRTYTVKVVASVGGADQALQTSVMVVGMPPAVPT